MYVIFPADDLISMTYGIAVPRFKPRPTLDNLREPLVQIGIDSNSNPSYQPSPNLSSRPPPSPSRFAAEVSSKLQQQNQIESQFQFPPKEPLSRQPSRHSRNSRHSIESKVRITPPRNKTSSREPSLSKSLIVASSQQNSDNYLNNQRLQNNYDCMSDTEDDERYMRERSPSLFLEPSTQGADFHRPPQCPTSGVISKSTPSTPKSTQSKSRLRPKLNISLGRLGRSQPEQPGPESYRLKEDLKIHVENPTFTRENIHQRNFDAFFESGEPVYQLEQRQLRASTQTPEDELERSGSAAGGYESGGSATPNKNRLGLFTRNSNKSPVSGRSRSVDPGPTTAAEVPQKDFLKSSSGARKRNIFGWREARGGSLGPQANMASSYSGILKDYGHSNLNEAFKTHNGVSFKLVKTVSDFTETLSHLYEEHATALQTLISTYRKKNGEIRKERPACHSSLFQAWETFLQEIEADSQASSDVASTLSRQVSRPMLDRSFHRKVQSRKIFTHRESFETIIAKTEDKLSKCRMDYKQAYMAHRQNPSQHTLVEYIDSHNAYVQQLQATNAMLESYHCDTIPQLMQELEEIYNDLCNIVAEAVMQGSEIIASKAVEQAKRYNSLTNQCQSISPQQDLQHFVRILPASQQKIPKRAFVPPQAGADGEDPIDDNSLPPLKNELVIDRHSSTQLRTALESLKRESADLDTQIRQLQDSVDTLIRTQTRGIENQLYNKANELQEDLSMKKFDLRAKQLHSAALRAQKELFLPKSNPVSPQHGERKFPSAASAPSMKTKWLKAFRSLKPASGYSTGQPERRNGAASTQPLRPNEDGSHNLSEYTYKKITPCDVCSQILRGHTRQGLRCRICKLNSHADCASQLPKCQTKQKLLRRQKSTSEIENRVDLEDEKITDIDQIYRVLKQAGEIKSHTDKTATSATIQQKSDQIQQDIPIVNVPECPERRGMGTLVNRRGPTYKPPPSTIGLSNSASGGKSGGLTAPTIQDMSSSDYRIPHNTVNASNSGTTTSSWSSSTNDSTGLRRRLFAGFRPLSAFSRSVIGSNRNRSPQHRSISLPESNYETNSPHSPRRQKLNLRMKSLSLDSPESTELHGQIRRRQQHPIIAGPSSAYYQGGGSGGHLEHSTPPSNNSRLHSPSSPSHSRKLLYANRGLRTGSVDLPDEVEKSLSSASTSPCPSPVRQIQKSHRLLPTNLYVILYNFKARHGDELDLKAGYKVTVIDTSDPDWWKGKCLGRIGYFPSKYCARLNAGEKPLQVTHNLQVSDGERGESMSLLRDQIVVQVGDEVNGMVLVRSADNRQGYCPIKYLQEV